MKSLLTIVLLILSLALNGVASVPPPTPPAPVSVNSVGVIGTVNEPGDCLVVTGQVFTPDGVTPAANVIVYAYQTDSTGQYHNDASGVARLHGWAKTDAQGRFEFRTIRPGAYPGHSVPAHIHFHIYGGGYPLQWTQELMFADDRLLKPEQISSSAALGKFGGIQAVTRSSDGTQRCTFNIRASKTTNYPAGTAMEPQR